MLDGDYKRKVANDFKCPSIAKSTHRREVGCHPKPLIVGLSLTAAQNFP